MLTMQSKVLEDIFTKLEKQKDELVQRLVSFVLTDTILFLPESLEAKNCLQLVNELLNTHFVMNKGLDVSKKDVLQVPVVEDYLKKSAKRKVAYIYLAATEIRSVLLAILLAENKISKSEAFDCAFFEELSEQKKWGTMPESLQQQQAIQSRLNELESLINAGSLS